MHRAFSKLVIFTIILLAGFLPAADTHAQSPKRLVAYYYFGDQTETPKYTAAQIPYTKLTHLIHVAVQPVKAANGEIEIFKNALEPDLVPKAHKAHVKVLVCVQGAASVFRKIAANDDARVRFGASLKAFVVKYGYDGVDIDWEVPEHGSDVTNCTAMMQALRDALPAPHYLLSMATPSTPGNWGEYDFTGLTPIVDFYNVMTYDYHGPWTKITGHNSPLFTSGFGAEGSLDESVNLYLNKFGVSPEKINLGTAFYGYEFPAEAISVEWKPGRSVKSRNYGPYIKQRIDRDGWRRRFDSISMAPYLVHETDPVSFITYDDPQSTARKVIYALQVRDLGGVFMWELSADFDGKHQDLLDSMHKAFLRSTAKNSLP
ncbi:MAG TPA: glycoside hydrolase family 18 protein [Verrucomicrobiae bacterium]|nr:glycoside hydrolase family 18 protein [Verrucomicrobiae bacterium]